MTPVTNNKKNRYPGIRSFEKGDKTLFYGRSLEIEELYNLIKIKPIVVLFGKSGLGKTSLLKAGVGPLLEEKLFFPLLIRLQNVSISPTKSVLNALEPFLDKTKLEKSGGKTNNKIWDYLNACSFKNEHGVTMTPILIVDQFEEFFNHSKKVREEWTAHLADLIDGRLPEDIEGALNQIPRDQRTPEIMDWYTPPTIKVVFAIRSDRMSELHQLRYEIPAILQNRYEVKPLRTRQATVAIEKPAALTGSEYCTLPFSYAPETIQTIQKELSNEQDEIESFQLQIVCQYIEQKVRQIQEKAALESTEKGSQQVVITPDYLGDADGIKKILKTYYDTQVASLGTEEEQLTVRKFLEEGLIVNKRRISVAEAVVKETYHIDDELLGKLLFSRLIRPEDTQLGRTYEVSHDTLVEPILKAYEKRRAKEEWIAGIEEEKQKKKEEEQRRIEKERTSKIINMTTALFILASISGAAIWGWYGSMKKSNELIKKYQDYEQQNSDLVGRNLDYQVKIDSVISLYDSVTTLNQEYEKALTATGTGTAQQAAKEIINEKKQKETEEAAKLGRLKSEIGEIYSTEEAERSKAAINLLKYTKDPAFITQLIEVSKDSINVNNLNSIYQSIWLLEKSSPAVLNQANKTKSVSKFIASIREAKNAENGADLVGVSTKARLDNIEGKLKSLPPGYQK